jgi:phosphoribosylanthranilate isomerase
MTWIKICGITNLEDALTAVDAGADALGFVFYEKSPRKIDPEVARRVIAQLPPGIEKIGVMVNDPVHRIQDLVQQVGLTAVQVHVNSGGSGRMQDLLWMNQSATGTKIIPALPADDLGNEGLFPLGSGKKKFYALMLDSGTSAAPGGTGRTFDWRKARAMVQFLSVNLPVIVAGGLTPLNVGEAIELFQPWGVDVASGVEARLGKKDPEKVRAFIAAVRSAEKVAQ